MKEIPRLAFFLTVALTVATGLNCAITDYGIITDNDQTRAGAAPGKGPIVDTAGKAHLFDVGFITVWPDGTDELINFVDQAADGTATLTTYNHFSTGSEPQYHDDLYCNTAWTGCAIFTAPDDNDENLFDGRWNQSCAGSRSLSILVSTGRYYGECGAQRARLNVKQKLALLGSSREATAFGMKGLLWRLDGQNTTVLVRNLDNGLQLPVPGYGAGIEVFLPNRSGRSGIVWLDHAMLAPALRDFASRLEHELHAEALEVTIRYNGVPVSFTIAGGANTSLDVPGRFRSRANQSF